MSAGSFAKAIGIGAAAGTVGGASTHLGSNLSKGVSNEVGKAVTRVGVQATTAAATDATLQLIDKGEIDPKQLILNTAGQITVATTAEISQNVSKSTQGYASKVNSEVIEESVNKIDDPNIDKNELKSQLKTAGIEINALSSDVIEQQVDQAHKYDTLKENIQQAKYHERNLKLIQENPYLSGQEKTQHRQEYCRVEGLPLDTDLDRVKHRLEIIKSKGVHQLMKPKLIGPDKKIHFLHGPRITEAAADLNLGNMEPGEYRNGERAVFKKIGDVYVYGGHTLSHDYANCDIIGVENMINDPFNALRPEHLNPYFTGINEEEEVGDKKND